MRRVEVDRLFPHPTGRVFQRYTDHVGWSEWAGLGRVRLTREGAPDRNGVGAVRAFSVAPGLREEVTVFEPPAAGASSPARMEYRVTRGPVPMADHRGEVIFTPEGIVDAAHLARLVPLGDPRPGVAARGGARRAVPADARQAGARSRRSSA